MKLTYTNVNGYLIPNLTYKSGEQTFVIHNLSLESEFETGTYIFSFSSSIGFIR